MLEVLHLIVKNSLKSIKLAATVIRPLALEYIFKSFGHEIFLLQKYNRSHVIIYPTKFECNATSGYLDSIWAKSTWGWDWKYWDIPWWCVKWLMVYFLVTYCAIGKLHIELVSFKGYQMWDFGQVAKKVLGNDLKIINWFEVMWIK
mgnify:CR=1 FL=1